MRKKLEPVAVQSVFFLFARDVADGYRLRRVRALILDRVTLRVMLVYSIYVVESSRDLLGDDDGHRQGAIA